MPVRTIAALALAAALGCAADPTLGPFEARLHAENPRVGTIVDGSAGGALDAEAFERRLRGARFVLLGESHDHPDHHRLQARWLEAIASAGPTPTLVVEMIDAAKQPAIDRFLAEGSRDPDAFAARVGWADSGWPDFALYRAVFEVALAGGLPIVAAELPRMQSLAGDAPERSAGFGLDEPLPPERQAARVEEMFVAHCELVPRGHLAAMVDMQRARDARLALAMLRAAGDAGRAVLVAGNGHVRNGDVPALLERAGVPRGEIVNVGLLEVSPGDDAAPGAAAEYALAVFTPAIEREDPCERLRRRFEHATP